MISPDASGSQPPSSSLVIFANRKAMSTMNSSDKPARNARLSFPVRDLIRLKVSGVTMVMAPETANPYAPASAAELPKLTTNAERGDHQHPIHGRHIDLTGVVRGRMLDAQTRQQSQAHRLSGHGEDPRDHRLRCDDRCRGRNHDQGIQRPRGRHQVEGIADGRRILDQQRALSEIVHDQRRHDERDPAKADRRFAEMTHVGIQCLAAGDA